MKENWWDMIKKEKGKHIDWGMYCIKTAYSEREEVIEERRKIKCWKTQIKNNALEKHVFANSFRNDMVHAKMEMFTVQCETPDSKGEMW